jgi:hypothetical protein
MADKIAHSVVSVVAIAGICYMMTIAKEMGIDGKMLAVSMSIVAAIGGVNIVSTIKSFVQGGINATNTTNKNTT